MSELHPETVQRFWREYKDPMIQRVIAFMETVEQWALDGNPEFESTLTTLSDSLTNIDNVDFGQDDRFIEVANALKSGRSLRLLHVLDTARPGAASKLLIHAEETSKGEDDIYGLFLRRNIVFERLRLLSRVFAPERFALVIRALEGDDHA